MLTRLTRGGHSLCFKRRRRFVPVLPTDLRGLPRLVAAQAHGASRTFCRSVTLQTLCCLTFELSRTRRNDARARQKENVPTLLAGPGGMPLGLGLNEGLGITGPRRAWCLQPCEAGRNSRKAYERTSFDIC